MEVKLLNLKRKEQETELEFIYRVVHLKGSVEGLKTWQEVGEYLNRELGYDYTESYYRKRVQEFDRLFEALKGTFFENDLIQIIDDKKEALYKQQVKVQDRMRAYRKAMRDEARIDTLREALIDATENLEPVHFVRLPTIDGDNEAILLLGDWHYGAEFKNFKNIYNTKVARERINKVVSQCLTYCEVMRVRKLHVINLGDLVEGNIHVSLRVESEIDVIQQTMQAAEILAGVLATLKQSLQEVVYYHVHDNHGRINPDKFAHIEKENFAKIIDWFLMERLKGLEIQFNPGTFDDNLGYFELDNGKKVAFVHGHLDNVNQVFQNLGGLLRESLDYVFMGHYHVVKMKEFNGGKVFINGSLKGVDSYALSKRYAGNASQLMFVLDGENEIPIVINV